MLPRPPLRLLLLQPRLLQLRPLHRLLVRVPRCKLPLLLRLRLQGQWRRLLLRLGHPRLLPLALRPRLPPLLHVVFWSCRLCAPLQGLWGSSPTLLVKAQIGKWLPLYSCPSHLHKLARRRFSFTLMQVLVVVPLRFLPRPFAP